MDIKRDMICATVLIAITMFLAGKWREECCGVCTSDVVRRCFSTDP